MGALREFYHKRTRPPRDHLETSQYDASNTYFTHRRVLWQTQ